MTDTPSFSWINRKIAIQESSISGNGYRALQPIKKGERLIVQCGQCVDVIKIDSPEYEALWYYGFQVEPDVYLFPYVVNNVPCLDGVFRINHSCNPNAGFTGQVTLSAMRDIVPGEEITYDYAMTDIETDKEAAWTPQECQCGNSECRTFITGDDWKKPSLQTKYKNYFSTHVTRAIKELNSCSDTL